MLFVIINSMAISFDTVLVFSFIFSFLAKSHTSSD